MYVQMPVGMTDSAREGKDMFVCLSDWKVKTHFCVVMYQGNAVCLFPVFYGTILR